MKTIDLWRWRITDPASGHRYTTRHRMTDADALALDPAAQRVEGSLEQRLVPETEQEHQHTTPGRRGG